LSPNQAVVETALVSERAKQDWDDLTNSRDVRSYRSLEGPNSHLVVFETIASRYGTRNYSPDALKLAHGSGLASEVLAQITKPGEISAILNRPENIDHPLSNAIREVMERMTAGNLKQQEIYELCTNEIDTFALSRQLELDVAAIREELRDQELIVSKETLINPVQNAIGGLFKGPSIEEETKSANSSVAKAPRKNPAKSLEIEGPDFN
jgi:hypothetical protein